MERPGAEAYLRLERGASQIARIERPGGLMQRHFSKHLEAMDVAGVFSSQDVNGRRRAVLDLGNLFGDSDTYKLVGPNRQERENGQGWELVRYDGVTGEFSLVDAGGWMRAYPVLLDRVGEAVNMLKVTA